MALNPDNELPEIITTDHTPRLNAPLSQGVRTRVRPPPGADRF
ncbi:hypothetical protein ABZ297_41535 [Nonomuraea sp. NPDC005983]